MGNITTVNNKINFVLEFIGFSGWVWGRKEKSRININLFAWVSKMVKLLLETGKMGDGIQKIDNDLSFEYGKFE